jgi:hypothetical protein
MALEIEGKLFRKFDTERKTESFQAREFVLEIERKLFRVHQVSTRSRQMFCHRQLYRGRTS